MTRRPFSKPVHAKEERNGPPSADQGLSTVTANHRSSPPSADQGLSTAFYS